MVDRQLKCPSCDGPMQTVERRGVVIDICRECRGVFLDRGELDKLSEAADQIDSEPIREQKPPRADDEDYEAWRGRHDQRRRRGWLGEMLDFD